MGLIEKGYWCHIFGGTLEDKGKVTFNKKYLPLFTEYCKRWKFGIDIRPSGRNRVKVWLNEIG